MLRWLWPGFCLLLAACGDPAPTAENTSQGIRVDQRMAAPVDPGFERATTVRTFDFPRDHGPHPAFATEWWYFTGNLLDEMQRRFGYQLTLFRVGLKAGRAATDSPWRARQLYMGHLAISDVAERRHIAEERFSRAAAGLAGSSAGPPLSVWLGPWEINGADDSLFPLQLAAQGDDIGIDLVLRPGDRPLVLQGDRGLSRKSAAPGNASYYYSYTRLPTQGEISIGDETFRVEGNSWFDREWSSSALGPDQAGWDWFALQLDDGRDLMLYRMRDKLGNAQAFSSGTLVLPTGRGVVHLDSRQFELQPLSVWTSPQGTAYPVVWRLMIPGQGLDLRVEATFPSQEMPLSVRYWEGTVDVSGSHEGRGYLEMSGYQR